MMAPTSRRALSSCSTEPRSEPVENDGPSTTTTGWPVSRLASSLMDANGVAPCPSCIARRLRAAWSVSTTATANDGAPPPDAAAAPGWGMDSPALPVNGLVTLLLVLEVRRELGGILTGEHVDDHGKGVQRPGLVVLGHEGEVEAVAPAAGDDPLG